VSFRSSNDRPCRRRPPGGGRPEPGTSSFIRVLRPGLFPQDRTCDLRANEVPLETVANCSEPMACGPNVDQARDAQRTGRLGSGALVGGSRTGPTRAPSLLPTRRLSLLSPRAHLDRSATGARGSRSMPLVPVVTAGARRGPQIPDTAWIQHGPAHATTTGQGSGSYPIVSATDLLAVAGGKR
jgi:hypothetical protein